MGFLDGIFKKGAAELVGAVTKGLDGLFTNDEERAAKSNELARIKAEAEATILRHMEEMQKLALRENELENQDRDSARNREVAYLKATGHADWFQHLIGGLAVILMVGIVVFILNKEIPAKNEHVVMLVIGEVLGITTAIYAYHFGSSRGSRIKDTKP